MIALAIMLILTVIALTAVVFLLGFRLGGEHWQVELSRVRMDAAQAERRLHDLTRQTFVAMAKQVERQDGP